MGWNNVLFFIQKEYRKLFSKLPWVVIFSYLFLWVDIACSSPRFIIYYNSDASSLGEVSQTEYTHVILSFLNARIDKRGVIVLTPPKNMSNQWESVQILRTSGIKVMISFGGGLAKTKDYQGFVGREKELATAIGAFVRAKQLDGVDLDFEASDMFHKVRKANIADGKKFLIKLTKALRGELPAPAFSISHAPQSPYLNPEWHGGPYLDILKASEEAIDWITVQYYNNPGQDGPVNTKVVGLEKEAYSTSYRGLVDKDGALAWPSGKIVIGKPVYKADAFSGHISPEDIIKQIIQPLNTEFGDLFGGIAGWQFSTHTQDHRDWNSQVGKILFQ